MKQAKEERKREQEINFATLTQMTAKLKAKYNCFVNLTVEFRGHEPFRIEYFLYIEKITGKYYYSWKEFYSAYEFFLAMRKEKEKINAE